MLCDDSAVTDGSAKQHLSCQHSEQELERDESVTDVTEFILQNPVLQIPVPCEQDDKLRKNAQKFERAILEGLTQKCY